MTVQPRSSCSIRGKGKVDARRYEVRLVDEWRRFVRAGRWALLAAGLAAIALSAVAMGATSARHRSTIPAQSRGKATAKCKRGTTAVAGGFSALGFNPGNNRGGVARVSSRLVGKRGVKTRGFNFGRQPADLVSLAYCVKHGHGLQVRSSKVFVGPDSAVSAIARCRPGTKVVGGGFGTPGFSANKGPRVVTLTSRRAGQRKWRVEALNIGGDSSADARPGTLIAYAYCEKDPPKLITRSKRISLPVARVRTVQVACPRGGRAYSGGFDGNLQLTANPSASGVVTSKRAKGGRAWRASAIDISDTRQAKVTVYAYCRLR
jgi:hypothetical protein